MNNVFTRIGRKGDTMKFGEEIKINITVPRQGIHSISRRYFSIMYKSHLNFCLFTYLFVVCSSFFSPYSKMRSSPAIL